MILQAARFGDILNPVRPEHSLYEVRVPAQKIITPRRDTEPACSKRSSTLLERGEEPGSFCAGLRL